MSATPFIMPAIFAISMSGFCLLFLALSIFTRGRRRLIVQKYSLAVGAPSLIVTLTLFPLTVDYALSDTLSVVALFIGVATWLGIGSINSVSPVIRLGIVIPSRAPFHTELRRGLTEMLSEVRHFNHDDYLNNNLAPEDLAQFLTCLRRTIKWRPDYLICCSPSVDLLESPSILQLLRNFVRIGGRIIFIDNTPRKDADEAISRSSGLVTSATKDGAVLLAHLAKSRMADEEKVLIVAGPQGATAAKDRKAVFEDALPFAQVFQSEVGAWSEQGTYSYCNQFFATHGLPRIVIAGNDVMALGASRAVREAATKCPNEICEVFGYDGIDRALYSIAEPSSPFFATFRTPPLQYGIEIAHMIIADSKSFNWQGELQDFVIPSGPWQLVTKDNVDLFLGS